jgi:Zn finger protein HypA/HybF involved in hydrogenase expression
MKVPFDYIDKEIELFKELEEAASTPIEFDVVATTTETDVLATNQARRQCTTCGTDLHPETIGSICPDCDCDAALDEWAVLYD